jgi:RNA polymerase sigma-70 factor (ECF subfamily)
VSEDREKLLAELRPRAFAVAYRMLGSVAEAEDVVQEALLRLNATLEEGERIESPPAYIGTVAARLAIDELRSARMRRETYVGDWLPEPLVAPAEEGPASQAEMGDSLSFAFLVLLESLTPEERAALLLHDVFDYGYPEVAAVIEKSEDNARQLATRARRRVGEGRPRFAGTPEQHRDLGDRFFAAAERGDLEALEQLLARDVVLRGDGGGKVPALARSIVGVERVARTLANWNKAGARSGASARRATINGRPGALLLAPDGSLLGAMVLDVDAGHVVGVNSVVNPEKLRHLGPVADMRAVLRGDA